MKSGILVVASIALGSAGLACGHGTCQVQEPRQATVEATGATRLRVEAKAGSLEITGEGGLDEVQVRGTACAESRRALEKVELTAERIGDEVRIAVETGEGWGEAGALDLELRLPERLAVDVTDTSGEVRVDGVSSLRLKDGSGAIRITAVHGDVEIRDGSGEIELRNVEGSVVVEDGSGEIDLSDVRGGVTIERDSSGSIDVVGVGKDVLIGQDGSGSIHVEDVGGDFTVQADGSGGITYEGVEGRVSVPH